MVSGLEHRTVGRVARTDFFEVLFSGEMLSSISQELTKKMLHSYRGMTRIRRVNSSTACGPKQANNSDGST